MAAFIDAQGNTQQLEIGMEHIRAARDNKMSVRDYVNTTFPTNAQLYGDTFSQMCASEGIVLMPDRKAGVMPRSLDATLNSTTYQAGSIVTNPNNQARVLLMPAITALVEDKLTGNLSQNADAFDKMIASDLVIDGDWALWPVANYNGPENARSQVTSQLAKPASMLTLTTSENQVRIATKSLGVEWSDQAAKYLNLDFIALSIARQVAIERNAVAIDSLKAMINGDADVGQAVLSGDSVKNAKTNFDTTITVAGTLTQKAWMSWLNYKSNIRTIDTVVTDIAGAMAIEGRANRPTISGDNPNSPRIDTISGALNPGWAKEVRIFIMPADSGWTANTLLGFDSRYAVQRVISAGATMTAIEEFAMRRGTGMRFDYGSIARRLYDDAFSVLTLTV